MQLPTKIEANFSKEFTFKGLFAKLSETSKLNLHMTGIIRITSSGTSHLSAKQPHEIINIVGRGDWMSNNAPHAFFQVDFRHYLFYPNDYSLSLYSFKPDNRMKAWVMEGSLDGANWFCLDEQRLSKKFDGSVISCRMFSDCPIRFVRLSIVGQNISGNNILMLHQIEFFGSLIYDANAPIRLKSAGFI